MSFKSDTHEHLTLRNAQVSSDGAVDMGRGAIGKDNRRQTQDSGIELVYDVCVFMLFPAMATVRPRVNAYARVSG